MIQRLLNVLLRRTSIQQQTRRYNTSESILVALNALYHTHPEWIEKAADWTNIQKGIFEDADLFEDGISEEEALQLHDYLKSAIATHDKKFSNWPPNDDDVDAFLNMSKGIRIV